MARLLFVLVLCVCSSAVFGDTLELRIVAGETQIPPGVETTVYVTIEGRLVTGDTDGLALFGFNLTASGDVAVNLCDTAVFLVTAPAGDLQQFDRNEGLTNPPDMAASGFSGTCDGGTDLWQIGGGQNTIGNTGPVLYPVGIVVTGVANAGWTVLAEGSVTLTLASGESVTLALNTGFANTLDIGGGPSTYAVSDAPVTIIDSLVINAGCMIPECAWTDVNMDGFTDAGDLLVIRAPSNWNKPVADAAEPRGDVNGDGFVDAGDLLSIRAPSMWNTTTGPCGECK